VTTSRIVVATKPRNHETTKILAAAAIVAAVAAVSAQQQKPDRAKPPEIGPAPALHLPAIQKSKLSNGLPVWVVEMHKVPVVQVNLVVFAGTADDPGGRYGAASLASAMLTNGAGGKSALDIADAVDFLGADLNAGSAVDSTTVRLHVPVARLADALPIMADVALHPTFQKDELDRLRQQRLTGLIQSRDDPQSIAAAAFPRVLYGPRHRYGTPAGGTAETIKTFTSDDLREFYTTTFRPDRATLLAIGDITPAAVVPLLEKHFGTWKAPSAAAAKQNIPAVDEPATRTVYVVDKPGAPQSQVRIGWIGVARSTPDYFPLTVMNTVLGGSFTSRLNMNLREKHGYSYGASSVFDMRLSAGPFASAAGVQTDKTGEALKEFFNELNAIREPVPADELARAKNYVALRYPGGFETTGDVSRQLENALVYHLPDDYFSSYVQKIQAVTAADVRRVAQKYVQPDRFAVVVVGDLSKIEPQIKALNLGTIKVLTIDDVFGPKP